MISKQNKFWKSIVVANLATLALGLVAADAVAAGSIKAAYVEQVIPAKTYYGSMTVVNATKSVGPDAGIYGVTSITITNYDSAPQQVFIFNPVLDNTGGCGVGKIIGGGNPQMEVYVQPNSTLHLTYPTPLVFNPLSGHTCVGAEVTTTLHGGSVEVDVNGVIN